MDRPNIKSGKYSKPDTASVQLVAPKQRFIRATMETAVAAG
jgi:hypothetical protein